ncbi:hypothetical protein [Streptomyces spongiae]|uniref:Uncharacterized protein n=1 Tax=Streptomyces spongiae TaxID=565072 RepID=A0A5N8XQG3_9ACTN|nr:hypothetical protein [Streptomyces spongiae]MPY61631.1 hypothetical protein [Streptomyces spongiae]
MDEPRRSSSGTSAALWKPVPPPALCGFLLLLALMFAVSYAVGAAAGPVAPGMSGTTQNDDGRGGTNMDDMDDMGDMGDVTGGRG